MSPLDKDVLTIDDVCALFSIHKVTVWRLRKKGLLQSFNIGRLVRFDRSAVMNIWKFIKR